MRTGFIWPKLPTYVATTNDTLVRNLYQGEFIDQAHKVVLVGGPGTGKTHLSTALGAYAIEDRNQRVRFYSTIELVNALELEKVTGKQGQIALYGPRDPR